MKNRSLAAWRVNQHRRSIQIQFVLLLTLQWLLRLVCSYSIIPQDFICVPAQEHILKEKNNWLLIMDQVQSKRAPTESRWKYCSEIISRAVATGVAGGAEPLRVTYTQRSSIRDSTALCNQAVDYTSCFTENQSFFTKQWFKFVSLTKLLISEQNQQHQTKCDNHSSTVKFKKKQSAWCQWQKHLCAKSHLTSKSQWDVTLLSVKLVCIQLLNYVKSMSII